MTTRGPAALCWMASVPPPNIMSMASCASAVARDDHALARSEAVGLDDDRRSAPVDILVRCAGFGERLVGGRRYAMPLHESFREILGASRAARRIASGRKS